MDLWFFAGLALSIPLSVLGNLATPKVQEFLSRRSEKKRAAIDRLLAERNEVVTWFAENPSLFMAYLVRTGFELVGPILFMLAMVVFYLVVKFGELKLNASQPTSAIPLVLFLLAGIYVFNILGRVVGFWVEVREAAGWPVTTGFKIRQGPDGTHDRPTVAD